LGVSALTLYAFSAQNWSRPAEEVAGLMDLLREYLIEQRSEILDNQIRLNAIGDLDRLPKWVREPLEALRRESAHNTGMVLTLALSYGGREDLLQATRSLARALASGEIQDASVSDAALESRLWTSGLPAVDLVIRSSGEQRLSNFLLWQAAYAELIFVETLWPDFRAVQFAECLLEFQQRERRFGKTSAQLNK
jgi:undecaprenyl diphosphate synthase